jgi:hypothetical protein
MENINIVCSRYDTQIIKYCDFFRQNLGVTVTKAPQTNKEKQETTNGRIFNLADVFSYNYRMYYNRPLFAFGNIEYIKMYYDMALSHGEFRVYINQEEYIHNIKYQLTQSNINQTLLKVITDSKNSYYKVDMDMEEKKNAHQQKLEELGERLRKEAERGGDASKLWNNPGSVSAKDVYEYLKQHNLDKQEKYQKFKH